MVSSQEVRIPPGVGHSAVLQSLNGVPVVAERTVAAAAAVAVVGTRRAARRPAWPPPAGCSPAGQADRHHDGWVVLYNPGPVPVRAVLDGLSGGPRSRWTPSPSPPGGGPSIHLNQLRPVARRAAGGQRLGARCTPSRTSTASNGTPGISLSFGVPLSP